MHFSFQMTNSITVVSLHIVDNLNVVEGGWFDWPCLTGLCLCVCALMHYNYKCIFAPTLALLCLCKWVCACLPLCDWTRSHSHWFEFSFWLRASPWPCALLMLHGVARLPPRLECSRLCTTLCLCALCSEISCECSSTRARWSHQPSEVQRFKPTLHSRGGPAPACKRTDSFPLPPWKPIK